MQKLCQFSFFIVQAEKENGYSLCKSEKRKRQICKNREETGFGINAMDYPNSYIYEEKQYIFIKNKNGTGLATCRMKNKSIFYRCY